MSELLSRVFGEEPVDPAVDEFFVRATDTHRGQQIVNAYYKHILGGASTEVARQTVYRFQAVNPNPYGEVDQSSGQPSS